jgi:hypothetical protein
MKRPELLGFMSTPGGLFASPAAWLTAEVRPDLKQIHARLAGKRLFVVPFSHVDWAWVNSRQWMIHRHSFVLSEALDLLKTMPDFRFYIETWNEPFDTFLERRPERSNRTRLRSAERSAISTLRGWSRKVTYGT